MTDIGRRSETFLGGLTFGTGDIIAWVHALGWQPSGFNSSISWLSSSSSVSSDPLSVSTSITFKSNLLQFCLLISFCNFTCFLSSLSLSANALSTPLNTFLHRTLIYWEKSVLLNFNSVQRITMSTVKQLICFIDDEVTLVSELCRTTPNLVATDISITVKNTF